MRRRNALAAALVLVALYVFSYVLFRSRHMERWDRDGRIYVIFPAGNMILYYFYRPLTYVDGRVTGVGFHIGPHR